MSAVGSLSCRSRDGGRLDYIRIWQGTEEASHMIINLPFQQLQGYGNTQSATQLLHR
jgi:hypothetical protein